jgi:integrase
MPAPLVNLDGIKLDDVVEKYLSTRTENTAKAYEKCLKRFRKFYGKSFSEYINHIERQRLENIDKPVYERIRPGEDTLRDFIEWHNEVGYSNYSTLQSLGAIQNILKFYGITISYEFINTPPPTPMRENRKHEWKLEHIKKFVESCDYLRDKAFVMVAFQSGLSIGDILALNYGDIQREYEAGTMPLAIQGFREKTSVEIRTFIGADALHYLRLYLESRPDIKPEDPLFTLLSSEKRATRGAIQNKLRDYAEKLKFLDPDAISNGYNPARPHSLRSGFRSRLTGKMDEQLIEFLMAHDIGQEKSTYMNMPLDELREIYANYEHLLAIHRTSKDEKAKAAKTPQEYQQEIQGLKQRILDLNEELISQNSKIQDQDKEIKELRSDIKEIQILLKGGIPEK